MHYCLSIPEILHLIVENLDFEIQVPYRAGQSRSKALAALARTSRAFGDVALDELWTHLVGLERILCCMPPDLFSGRRENRVSRLLRPMKASDWDRPRIYMNRVKHLWVAGRRVARQNSNIFAALNGSFPAGEVESYFRRLRSVQWLTEHDLLNIRFLLSPRLNALSLDFPSSHTNFSFLSSIPLICPGLKELGVNALGIFSTFPDGPFISELTCGLHSLQKLRIAIPDLTNFEHISRVKGLTSLECLLSNTLPMLFSPLSFDALEEVTVFNGNLDTIIDLFSRCSLPVLKRLKIHPSFGITATGVDKLHKVLSRSCTPSSLTTLELTFDGDDEGGVEGEDPELYTIPFRSFEPLFCFVNLTSFCIASKSGICLNDEELEIIARTWPHLRHLTLWERVECLTLSLRSLSILAEHCPLLESLTLTLDPESDPELLTSNGHQPISQLALHTLDVNRSPISAPTLFTGRFLSSIFPNLSVVTTDLDVSRIYLLEEDEDSELKEYHDLWKEVESQLSVFKAIREEEKARV
ncbi:hypothetical protein R3P38DRAFT_2518143 [Favolaschia claudopus]|uniref:F-box domain-containing protein n=1 Tax=Favolaschia claudopus TaxID=2862362 RepID=A0AAW0CDR1_9AGAR